MGVVDGIAGVFANPIIDAQKDGVGGFFKGVGKGVVGLVVKPVAGVFDGVSAVASGVRNTTTMMEDRSFTWIRYPRAFYGPDRQLLPYNEEDSKQAYKSLIESKEYD
jgi:vacuolar protein sorting-associated protein 13A/C